MKTETVAPIMISDRNAVSRQWFWGDAAHQRAEAAAQINEYVYRVTIDLADGSWTDGWAVGSADGNPPNTQDD